MGLLQDIILILAFEDILLHTRWIPTKENCLADALSRHHLQSTADMFPQLNIAL